MPTTSGLALPYPALTAAPNVPADIQALADRLEALLGGNFDDAWQTYAPAWTASTSFTLGNGTQIGRHFTVGKFVAFHARLLLGTTTSFTGAVRVAVPFTAVNADALEGMGGLAVVGAGPTFDAVTTQAFTTSAVSLFANRATVTNTSPGTWQSGNAITVRGVYERA